MNPWQSWALILSILFFAALVAYLLFTRPRPRDYSADRCTYESDRAGLQHATMEKDLRMLSTLINPHAEDVVFEVRSHRDETASPRTEENR